MSGKSPKESSKKSMKGPRKKSLKKIPGKIQRGFTNESLKKYLKIFQKKSLKESTINGGRNTGNQSPSGFTRERIPE